MIAIVDRRCRWETSLGVQGLLKLEQVGIQAQLLGGVQWDLSATEVVVVGVAGLW